MCDDDLESFIALALGNSAKEPMEHSIGALQASQMPEPLRVDLSRLEDPNHEFEHAAVRICLRSAEPDDDLLQRHLRVGFRAGRDDKGPVEPAQIRLLDQPVVERLGTRAALETGAPERAVRG